MRQPPLSYPPGELVRASQHPEPRGRNDVNGYMKQPIRKYLDADVARPLSFDET